ncbi:hypothetical protein Pyn_22984 [Prunus yedoensis var. nudiflora]|uniref:Uncharacterized protein n=1 Tax=Prunus yedoensis var. nudiflora TaxID=2094558 RepID=A0A314ZEW8_PRUYE|nr:hypothetical protein Pyn_22984 [Prunus yedoensis var. nudiflora]
MAILLWINYRRIIRNIIRIFVELGRYFERCNLDLEHLIIVDNEVQRSFRNYIHRSLGGRLCKLQCKFVLERILGKDDRRKELKHFYEMAQIQGVTLTDLWHHPLLMTCNERYFFPYQALIELMCVGNWETDYSNYTENHIPSYGKRNIETTIQNSKYAIAFESVYHETYQWEDGYQNNAVGELTYSKNIVDRIDNA